MAEVSQQEAIFGYRNVEILKENSLGIGSYGAVYKARCDDLPCAAKILHPTLFQSNDPGARRLLQKFEQECSFMNRIRHPNIVLFLGVWRDQQSNLPVLLMELLDENLTTFLERSQEPLPFHIQVNFCYDVALALSYLHSNNIIHRDLSSNNVLLVAGNKAKVTDFGMSKLISKSGISSRFSRLSLTQCPGTESYMPPEAIRNRPAYTDRLDCFSFGPLAIQIITRLFPDPGDRTKAVMFPASPTGTTEVPILEPERRQSHIRLINPEHPLLPIAIGCIEYKPEERPSAQEICRQIRVVRESPQYIESEQSIQANRQVVRCHHERVLTEKDEEIRMLEESNEELVRQTQELQRENAEQKEEIDLKDEELQELTRLLQAKEHEVQLALDRVPQAEERLEVNEKKQSLSFPRSIAETNLETTGLCTDMVHRHYEGSLPTYAGYTLSLPSLVNYPSEFRQMVIDHLADKETQKLLEEEHTLNWCKSTSTLIPLKTKRDGNSLCHAAALGMWGLDDNEYKLRKALHSALTNDEKFRKRYFSLYQYKNYAKNSTQVQSQCEKEWERIVSIASVSVEDTPKKHFENLEEFHIFVLANILQRPIIVYSNCNDMISTSHKIHGFYLPDVSPPYGVSHIMNCNPLPLGYHNGCFSALSSTNLKWKDYKQYLSIPIYDYYGRMLPIKCALSGDNSSHQLRNCIVTETLDAPEIKSESPYFTTTGITCARLVIKYMPESLQRLMSEFVDACYIKYVNDDN